MSLMHSGEASLFHLQFSEQCEGTPALLSEKSQKWNGETMLNHLQGKHESVVQKTILCTTPDKRQHVKIKHNRKKITGWKSNLSEDVLEPGRCTHGQKSPTDLNTDAANNKDEKIWKFLKSCFTDFCSFHLPHRHLKAVVVMATSMAKLRALINLWSQGTESNATCHRQGASMQSNAGGGQNVTSCWCGPCNLDPPQQGEIVDLECNTRKQLFHSTITCGSHCHALGKGETPPPFHFQLGCIAFLSSAEQLALDLEKWHCNAHDYAMSVAAKMTIS